MRRQITLDKTYTVVLEPAEEGGFVVHVPALPEVCTEGDTEAEALANAREAIEVIIEHRLERGQPIPPDNASSIRHVTVSVPVAA